MSTPTIARPKLRAWDDIPRYATAQEVAEYLACSADLVIDRFAARPCTIDLNPEGQRRQLRFCKGCILGQCQGESA